MRVKEFLLALLFLGLYMLFLRFEETLIDPKTEIPKPEIEVEESVYQNVSLGFPDFCEWAKIDHVNDGDTITTNLGKVRFLGINTPEVAGPHTELQPGGKEASAYLKNKLKGSEKVCLFADMNAGNKDKYDRLLRYVFTDEGEHLNLDLVREGYAEVYNKSNFTQKEWFFAAQKEARKFQRGVWGF